MTVRAFPPWKLSGSRRVPVILQSEASECGLACLCMVAHYFGHRISLTELRRDHGTTLRGTTLKQLMEIASATGLSARALKLELNDLSQLQLPCILHWNMQHFVVLSRISGRNISILDPALGKRTLSWEQVSAHFTGIALELRPSPQFTPSRPSPQLRFRDFWQRAWGIKRSLALVFVLSALLQVFAIASPYYLQTVIDDVLLRQQKDLLLVLALGFGLLLLIEVVTGVFRRLVILAFSSHLHLQMSGNLFQHLLQLPVAYFSKRHLGDVVSRFGSLAQVRELFTVGLVTAVLDGLMALITLVVMAVYSPHLAAIVTAVVLAYLLIRLATVPTLKRLNGERIAEAAREQSHFMESVKAIQTVKLLDQQSGRHNQWMNHLATTLNFDIRLGKWDISVTCLNQLLFGIENLLVIYFAALEVMGNAMTVGMLYAFISYKNRFIQSIDALISKGIEFKMLDVHFDRLADIVFAEPESPAGGSVPLTTRGDTPPSLELHNLSYRYGPLEQDIFTELNLSVPANTTLAIIGPSGSGKSTLLKCMMGMLAPTQGEVRYAGVPVSQNRQFRQCCASVLQDDYCLAGSIAENICGFDDKPDQSRMLHAAQLACLHPQIMAMPMQYQTLVGDMGSSLSGGQLQRLLLARALYRQPQILFLDEASSHLDIQNEAAINHNLQQLSLTRVIVAHRPQTIAMAERIYLLEAGRLTDVTTSVKSPTSNFPSTANP